MHVTHSCIEQSDHRYSHIYSIGILVFTGVMHLFCDSGGQSTQIKYLSKSTDTYNKILLQ